MMRALAGLFLLGGMTVNGSAAPAVIAGLDERSGATPGLAILGQDYPRAFFFRACESGPSRKGMMYEDWAAEFGRLSGMIGKCLDEEVVGREARNPDWFSRFKRDHPRQVVLLHFNGNARDPRYETQRYFPGHWIYRRAARIVADVPDTADDTLIRVEDARNFRVGAGRYRTANDDLALFGVTPDGKHDWMRCEQVQLLAVDRKANTIRVRRGCYGTTPLAFTAGQARAAAHQVEGPWGKANHLLWFYNFATHCPKDPEGKTCADRLVDDLAGWLGKGGKLEAFDGLEFDVMFHTTLGDTDGDGEPDDGVIGGVNRYGIGMVGFARQLRSRLGQERIIQGDGALGPGGIRSQRAFGLLNGIESEGWPNLRDWNIDDWSGGLNRHAFWQANAHKPAFSYVNHKWVEPVAGERGEVRSVEVPFARHRLVFAAAQFTDAMVCYALAPPGRPGGRMGIWDELVCGAAQQPGWLGKPEGEAVHLAALAPDRLGGIGAPAGAALAKRIHGQATARAAGEGVVLVSADASAPDVSFSIRDVPVDGEDLVVLLTMEGAPRQDYPREMARLAQVQVGGGVSEDVRATAKAYMTWLNERPFTSGFYFRGIRSKTVDLTVRVEGTEPVTIRSITAHAHPDAMYRTFENGLVLANPAPAPYAFDLAKLSPGRAYRRIQATPEQDTEANDGEPVGTRVTLGPLDGLFLVRDDGDP